jgi:hypothetical protein
MRRAEVEKAADYMIKHPYNVDYIPRHPEDFLPWKIRFTKEEQDYLYELMLKKTKELTEWPEAGTK